MFSGHDLNEGEKRNIYLAHQALNDDLVWRNKKKSSYNLLSVHQNFEDIFFSQSLFILGNE